MVDGAYYEERESCVLAQWASYAYPLQASTEDITYISVYIRIAQKF